jgi:crotonobetainyl-CoA:carnitine CoA-transferase CaiB-like acyl-CoA transferase
MDLTSNGLTFVIDECAGANAAAAVLMALHWRNRTGKGMYIDMAQSESGIPYLSQALMDCVMNGRVQERMGNRSPYGVQGCYRCRGDDRWINISIFNDEQWQGLCRAMGNPEWTREERFSDQLSRMKNHDALDKLLGDWTQQHDDYALMHLLQREGVPAGPVINERDAYNDPHLKERDFFHEADQEDCGRHSYPGPAWKMSKTPNRLRRGPVQLGQDNEYVYKKVIGVSDEEYAKLETAGHIGMDYVPEIP